MSALRMAALTISISLLGCSAAPNLLRSARGTAPVPAASTTSGSGSTPATSAISSAFTLPRFAEIAVGGNGNYELGDTWGYFGRHDTWLAFQPVCECSAPCANAACSKTDENITSEVVAQKIDNLESLRDYVRRQVAYEGYSTGVEDGSINFNADAINFVISAGVSAKRTWITDPSAVALQSASTYLVQRNVTKFVQHFGRYFISGVEYGASTVCSITVQGANSGDGAYLSKLFADITSDVFFNSTMSAQFVAKVNEANLAGRLASANPQCSSNGPGPDVSNFIIDPIPSKLGALFKAWNDSLATKASDMDWVPLRASLDSMADVQEVKKFMQNMSSAEQAPVTSIQRITSKTTVTLENDLALAAFVQRSAQLAAYSSNSALNQKLNTLVFDVTAYFQKCWYLTGADMGKLQDQFSQGNFSWLQGEAFLKRYISLVANYP